jgi:1-hydroxycarotenoid 3,4-desaturase
MPSEKVIVIGAGVGGLTAAALLATHGLQVRLFERADGPGGKMRDVLVDGLHFDAGPTVFTMRWIFEEIFREAGASLDDYLRLLPTEIIARHAWSERERLDLFADQARTVDAIGDFAGAAEARGYLAFCDQARRMYENLDEIFIRSPRPTLLGMLGRVGRLGGGALREIKPYQTLWQALGHFFKDQRLRQLLGRYSTYCGSSPFLAPATLILIAHVEQQGVWVVEGGMHKTAQALARLAQAQGAQIEYEREVEEILIEHGRTVGVRLADGEVVNADAVVFNGDPAALAAGYLGTNASQAVPSMPATSRSLSAITWNLAAETDGFPLVRHNVFFARDYAREFDDIFRHSRLPREGTIYICAQDRGGHEKDTLRGTERLFMLLNAPAQGDRHPFDAAEIEQCEQRVFSLLERCGLRIHRHPEKSLITTPAEFDRLFPATGGALYGSALHGWKASFNRPGSKTGIERLYLAGGSTHPGAGIPMAAMSGRLATASLLADLAST